MFRKSIQYARRHLRIVLPVVIFALGGTVVLASLRTRERAITAAYASVERIQQREDLRSERITLRTTGFEPDVITRPAGRFLLAVNDRSGGSDTTITIVRETGERVHAMTLRDNPRKHEWRKVLNLPPGRYVMAEANHPEWTCQIVLTPN